MKQKRFWMSVLSVVLFVAASASIAGAIDTTLFQNILTYKGHIYAITKNTMNWNDANTLATQQGGHLVTVNDAAENQFLSSNYADGYGQPWIGLNDIQSPGTWVWADGEPTTYTDWQPGEPNNPSTEFCVMTNWVSPGLWNNGVCSENRLAIVEWEPTVWTGTFSFTLKVTSEESNNPGTQTFLTSNQPFAGTMSLYVGDNGLVKNAEGCYLKFLSADGTQIICITDIAGISTENLKSKSEKALVVGTGTFTTTIEGNPNPVTGNVYVDLKGTLKQDSSNNLVSVGLTGKVGGGANNGDNANFVFSATLNNTTLTKQTAKSF